MPSSMKLRNSLWILTVAAMALASCERKVIYSHYEPTSVAGWGRSDTLTFCVAPVPEDGLYQEQVGLRITSDYPFMGLSLEVEQHMLHSLMVRRDTLHAEVVDRGGNFLGEGIGYFQYRFKLTELPLNAGDTLMVHVRHVMMREILPGVCDVGVTVRRVKN